MTQKQRRTWGSITKLDKNVYRIRYWGDKRDGKGYRRLSKTVHGTRREADHVLAELRLKHDADHPTMTLGAVFNEWYLPYISKRVEDGKLRESTANNYLKTWERCIESRWTNVAVNAIKPLELQEWLLTISGIDGTNSLVILRKCLDLAVMYEVVEQNVAKNNYMLSSAKQLDKRVNTLAELCEIYQRLKETPVVVPFVLSAFGSCRTTEALSVTKNDVRKATINGKDYAIVAINKQVKSTGIDYKLKNPQSVRDVIIAPPMSEAIFKAASETDEWLCCSANGTPYYSDVFRHRFNRTYNKHCLDIPNYTFRNYRNSWRTYMAWDLHIPAEKLEKMMGHVGHGVGETNYNRPDTEMFLKTVVEAVEKYRPFDGLK